MLLKAIVAVTVLLVVLLLAYLGFRLRDKLLDKARDDLIASLREVDDRLGPLVFTGSSDYDRTAAALLAQSRSMQHGLAAQKKSGKPLAEHRAMVTSFLAGVDLFFDGRDVLSPLRGPILKGFVSEVDNSLQTYSVCVPKGYQGSRDWPLVVHLHGHGWFKPFQGHPAPEMSGAIVLSPEGRRASDYMWLGEDDVLRAIDEVKRDYRIDEARILISGTSMGGTGAWNLAAHYPHRFSGIAPRAGNCDFRAWERRWGWNPPLDAQHRDLRDYLLESDSPVTYLGNLTATPAYVVHNAADPVVPVEHARAAVAALRAIGAPVEYRERLVGRHGGFTPEIVQEQLAWLAAHPRRRAPRRFHFETRTLRHGRTWYLTVEQMAEVLTPATLDVVVEDDRLAVATRNVLALTVHGDELAEVRSLSIDGTVVSMPEGDDATFAKQGATWHAVDAWPPDDKLQKRRDVEGPVRDVLRSPFVVVAGTGGGERWCDAAEVESQRFVAEWKRRYGAEPPLTQDTLVTDETLAERNIVFFGRPADDGLLKGVLDRLPIKVTDDAVEVNAQRFTGDDVGTIFCYPTPEVRGRMVAVFTAASPEALYQVYTRFGTWFNWGVHDHRKWFDYCIYDAKTSNPETYPLVGFFGTDWSFERGKRWKPTPEGLARAVPQGVPKGVSDDATVYLSAVAPEKIDQMRGAVGFDRSFRGGPIIVGGNHYDRGLGVRCPSTITYRLGKRFKRLTAVVGFTAEVEETLSTPRLESEKVLFIVTGDGRKLHAQPVDWEDPAARIAVDVGGVDVLTLRVRAVGGALWLHGSTAWADIHLTR